MTDEVEAGTTTELAPGVVRGVGRYAMGNAGDELFGVTRRCRHLRADFADGSIDEKAPRYPLARGEVRRHVGPNDPRAPGCLRQDPWIQCRLPIVDRGLSPWPDRGDRAGRTGPRARAAGPIRALACALAQGRRSRAAPTIGCVQILCAGCGCLVDAGVRIAACGDPECCCRGLPQRAGDPESKEPGAGPTS